MKPDWKDAPAWAQFLVMDACGDWYWYEFEPKRTQKTWEQKSGTKACLAMNRRDWAASLEKRP